MSRCSTPDFSYPLTPKEMLLRTADPQDYPCWTEEGYYRHLPGCREKCCINPACTPEGEDTPKWSAILAQRMDSDSPIAQPLFGPPETPAKTILPEDYNPETGNTPLHGEGWQMTHARVNCDRPGVPGHSVDNPYCLATPTRANAS